VRGAAFIHFSDERYIVVVVLFTSENTSGRYGAPASIANGNSSGTADLKRRDDGPPL
jgi:hypothetical protein